MLLLVNPAMAQEASTALTFDAASLVGDVTMDGVFHGARVTAVDKPAFSAHGSTIRLVTVNDTHHRVADATVNPVRGGVDETLRDAFVTGGAVQANLDLVVFPMPGQQPPGLGLDADGVHVTPASGSLAEVAYVDGGRTTFVANLDQAFGMVLDATHSLRVHGDFLVSVWGWNLTIANLDVPTGSHRTNATLLPNGVELAADVHEQVAQLHVRQGWLQIDGVRKAEAFGNQLQAKVMGSSKLVGLEGTLTAHGHPDANASTLALDGEHVLEFVRDESRRVNIVSHRGTAYLDMNPVQLVDQPSIRSETVVSNGGGNRPWWLVLVGFGLVLSVAVFMHGPMRSIRFDRLERRFEDRDYLGVLASIDPFTSRAPFRRRASFLKAISLLSLHSYREAALYLESPEAKQATDPATRLFLQACAAAGQADDATAIHHLGACLQVDPSYLEEARTLPVLASILPYFELPGRAS